MTQPASSGRLFLDHNAGAPPDPEVARELSELLLRGDWANPSSPHAAGREARELVESAREALATTIGATRGHLTFHSGASEANAAALRHWALHSGGRRTILATPVEHPSVRENLLELERQGFRLVWADVERDGGLVPGWLEGVLDGEVAFCVCMSANNETGRLHPWRHWAAVASRAGIPLHVDATQSWLREPLEVQALEQGSMVWSGHKCGGLAGAGVLWHSGSGAPFQGLWRGGAQERSRRAGTESLLPIVSLGILARLRAGMDERAHWARWRALLAQAVADLPGVAATVLPDDSLVNTLHLSVPQRAETLVQRLDLAGVSVSAGSACASGSLRPSPVLLAMGWSQDQARRALRLSVGHAIDQSGVERACQILRTVLTR